MGLSYHTEADLSWKRVRRGKGFVFLNKKGKLVPKSHLDRLSKLAIPPAWKGVVVSPDPRDYIQAVGIDTAGRKQYIYHPSWIKRSQAQKFDQMIAFGEKLPTLRETVRAHMRQRALTQERILATIIWLLEHTFIRVGNKVYAEDNDSYGLTTMRGKHVSISGNTVTFSFKGKSGVYHELDVTHPRVTQTIKECMDMPGYEVFQYLDEDNKRRVVDSADVNDYLQTYTGSDFSAKDFRTWGGTVLAGQSLYKKGSVESEDDLKKNISDAVCEVSDLLGNTKKVCKTYYIHPTIIRSYEKDILVPHYERTYKRMGLRKYNLAPEEYAAWSLIKDS